MKQLAKKGIGPTLKSAFVLSFSIRQISSTNMKPSLRSKIYFKKPHFKHGLKNKKKIKGLNLRTVFVVHLLQNIIPHFQYGSPFSYCVGSGKIDLFKIFF